MRIKFLDNFQLLFDRGENVPHLSSAHYRRSPVLQGGLETPCTVTICFPASMKADMLIGKYKEIVESLDIQPKYKVTVCCFVEKNDYDKGVIREKNSKIEQNKTNDTRNFLKITGKLKNGEN